jgi:hypothetical protein
MTFLFVHLPYLFSYRFQPLSRWEREFDINASVLVTVRVITDKSEGRLQIIEFQ